MNQKGNVLIFILLIVLVIVVLIFIIVGEESKIIMGIGKTQPVSQIPTPMPSPTSVTQQSCNVSNDCPSGNTCETIGPIVNIPKRICVPNGQMVPLYQQ